MKRTILLSLALMFTSLTYSQYIQKQAGVRLGYTSGFFIKAVMNETMAFEGLLGFREGGIQAYGLIEQYKQVFTSKTDNFFIYYGPGVHFGYVTWDAYYQYDYYPYYTYNKRASAVIGIDGVLGLEYQVPTIPLVMAVDFKPFFELVGFYRPRLNLWDFAFTISYAF